MHSSSLCNSWHGMARDGTGWHEILQSHHQLRFLPQANHIWKLCCPSRLADYASPNEPMYMEQAGNGSPLWGWQFFEALATLMAVSSGCCEASWWKLIMIDLSQKLFVWKLVGLSLLFSQTSDIVGQIWHNTRNGKLPYWLWPQAKSSQRVLYTNLSSKSSSWLACPSR